jgi:hypothetical protein
LKDAGIAIANEAEKWAPHVRQMCLGLFSKVLQKMKDPRNHEKSSWLAENIESYAQAFLDCMRPQFKSKSNGGNQKRKLPLSEIVSGHKRNKAGHKNSQQLGKDDYDQDDSEVDQVKKSASLSQKAMRKEKACSICGQLFSSGHHTKGNCPNGAAKKPM